MNCFSLFLSCSHRRANTGLNHLVRVSNRMQNKNLLQDDVAVDEPSMSTPLALNILGVAQLIQAAVPQAPVRVLGMTGSPLSKNTLSVDSIKHLESEPFGHWPSAASQQQAWCFWPSSAVRAPLHAAATETCCFHVMCFNLEPSTPRCTSEAQEAQGTAGCEAAEDAAPVSTVVFLVQECLEEHHPFSISLPLSKAAGNDDVRVKIVRELTVRQVHRGRELRIFSLERPKVLCQRSTWQAAWWKWRRVFGTPWPEVGEHVNKMELRAVLAAM